jgi:hypothetical protein
VRLLGIEGVEDVKEWFLPIEKAREHLEMVDQGGVSWDDEIAPERVTVVGKLEFLRVGPGILAELDLLMSGRVDILYRTVECDDESSLPFVE